MRQWLKNENGSRTIDITGIRLPEAMYPGEIAKIAEKKLQLIKGIIRHREKALKAEGKKRVDEGTKTKGAARVKRPVITKIKKVPRRKVEESRSALSLVKREKRTGQTRWGSGGKDEARQQSVSSAIKE